MVGEMTSGVTYYESVKKMLALAESDWPALLSRLETVRSKIISKKNVLVNLTVDPAATPSVVDDINAFVDKLPAEPKAASPSSSATWREAIKLAGETDEAFSITTQATRHLSALAEDIAPNASIPNQAFARASPSLPSDPYPTPHP